MGGPKLSKKDIERIEGAGYDVKDFLEPAKSEFKGGTARRGSLKNREDGVCIFLNSREKNNRFECSIYNVRPVLCRLYPFDFEKVESNVILLKFIPCCRGLNTAEGELLNEKWIKSNLVPTLFDK